MFPRQKQEWPCKTLGRAAGPQEAVRRTGPGRPGCRRAFPGARFAAGAFLAAMLAAPTMALAGIEAGERGLVVSPTDLTIEEGGKGKISVVLKTKPTGPVTVRISRDSADGFAMDTQRMYFTTETWDRPQSVWLRARFDDDATDETTVFTFTPRGSDYRGLAPVTATARVEDYEGHAVERGLVISPTDLTLEEGERGKISVALKSRPKRTVAVRISRSSADGFAVDRLRMRFTTENWDRPQSIWLRAREDDDATDETTVFTFTPRRGGYDGLAPVTVTARVDDNDDVPVASGNYPTVSIADATADEGNASRDISFEVSLSEPSDRLVVVDIRTVPGGTATVGADYRHEWYTVFIPAGTTSVLAGVPTWDEFWSVDDTGD